MFLTEDRVREIAKEETLKEAKRLASLPKPGWQIGKAHYFDKEGKPNRPPNVFVRKKRSDYGSYPAGFIRGYYEELSEVSLEELLSHILKALDELGVELVQTKARPASWRLKKRDGKVK